MPKSSCTYKRHRFPTEVIVRAVWLYYRYPLSLRLVEEMLLERGIVVSYETIRQWGIKGEPKIWSGICPPVTAQTIKSE